jgi:signal transduction histidine kinase/CheY-like chemotaxis protein
LPRTELQTFAVVEPDDVVSDVDPHSAVVSIVTLPHPFHLALVSDVFMSPSAKKLSVALQIPVHVNGLILYYISLSSQLTTMQPLLGDHTLPEGWFGTVFNSHGVIAARTHEAERFVGQTAPEKARKFIEDQQEGFFEVTTLYGEPITAFVSRAPVSGWSFMIGVPQTAMRTSLTHGIAILATISASMLLLAITVAFYGGRKIAQPMEGLRQATARMRDSEPVNARRTGILEVDAVSEEMEDTRREIYETRAELETRIQEAVTTVERSQRALLQAQKMEALGRLTGGIAHDFNNVLQTPTTGLQLTYIASTDERIKKAVQSCQRAVERAAELVRQLMVFGRVQDAHLTTVNLKHKIKDITPMLKGGVREDVELQFDVQDDLWSVMIDPLQFELAILNIAMNARDAMQDGGILKISLKNAPLIKPGSELAPGDYVQISVQDNGTGMPPDVVAKALDPLFTTKSVGKGTGLGLPQVYGFVTQAGGDMSIESQPGIGTTIHLFLPRGQEEVTSEGSSKTVQDLLPRLSGNVLLVDDDILVLEVVKPALEAAGLTVRAVASGDEALVLLGSGEAFNIVFSDIVMPGQINGIALAKVVEQQYPHIGIILATGYTNERIAIRGMRTLAKPYAVKDAIDSLRAELDKKR